MADFNTIDELLTYEFATNPAYKNQGVEFEAGDVNLQDLREYAKELRQAIMTNLDTYYAYIPMRLDLRTEELKYALNRTRIDAANNLIVIDFNDAAWHPSISKKHGHESFMPVLVNYGWNVGPKPRLLERSFNYYGGSNYITDAIEKFNDKYKKRGIYAKFEINGKPVESYGSYVPYLLDDF